MCLTEQTSAVEWVAEAHPAIQDRGQVAVGHHARGIAVVTMRGEHDLSTQPVLAQALALAAARWDYATVGSVGALALSARTCSKVGFLS